MNTPEQNNILQFPARPDADAEDYIQAFSALQAFTKTARVVEFDLGVLGQVYSALSQRMALLSEEDQASILELADKTDARALAVLRFASSLDDAQLKGFKDLLQA